MLVRRQPTPATRDWYVEHAGEYRAHIAADPFLGALIDALFRPRWIADFLTPPPDPADRTFFDSLRSVREADPDAVRAVIRDGSGRLPPLLADDDVAERTADLLEWIWTQTVSAEWPRRKLILEADVLSRTRQLALGGWSAALEGLRPGMRWLGEGELRINAYNVPPRDLAGAQLSFVPFTGPYGWVSWDQQGRHAIVYPCAGALVENDRSPVALTRLMGRNRALAHPDRPTAYDESAGCDDRAQPRLGRRTSRRSSRRRLDRAPTRRTLRRLPAHPDRCASHALGLVGGPWEPVSATER